MYNLAKIRGIAQKYVALPAIVAVSALASSGSVSNDFDMMPSHPCYVEALEVEKNPSDYYNDCLILEEIYDMRKFIDDAIKSLGQGFEDLNNDMEDFLETPIRPVRTPEYQSY